MKIYLGADHNGYDLKEKLEKILIREGYEVYDEGGKRDPEDDFPTFAAQVVHAMKASGEKDPRGVLICGSGQGMCMAANRFKGIRASLVWNAEETRAARNDDDANIICLPARYIDENEAVKLVEIWLNTPFAGATRFKRRIREMDELV